MVLLAVPWNRVQDAAASVPVRDGRIVRDPTISFSLERRELADLGDRTGSEYFGSLIPRARVIKAFDTLYARYIAADPRHAAGQQVVFFAGDNQDAKDQFQLLLNELGSRPSTWAHCATADAS